MVDPAVAMAGIASGLTLLERVVTLAKSIGDTKNKQGLTELEEKLTEARGKIASITGTLAEQAADNYALQQELQKVKESVKEREKAAKFAGTLVYRDNAYWTEKGDGPYCSGCWDGQQKGVRLAKKGLNHECPVCDASFIVNKSGMYPSRPGTLNPLAGDEDEVS